MITLVLNVLHRAQETVVHTRLLSSRALVTARAVKAVPNAQCLRVSGFRGFLRPYSVESQASRWEAGS
jgi:hypothetical protein